MVAAPQRVTARDVGMLMAAVVFIRQRSAGQQIADTEDPGARSLGALNDVEATILRTGLCAARLPEVRALKALFARRAKESGSSTVLGVDDVKKLQELASSLRQTLDDYLNERNFEQTLPTTGLFDYGRLLKEGIGVVLPNELRWQTSPLVARDLELGLLALARDLPLASAMCTLRSPEGALRVAYKKELKQDPPPKDYWFDISKDLFESLKTRKIDVLELEGFVHSLRLIRNQAMHPGREFERHQAENAITNARQLFELLDKLPAPP